MCHRDVGGTPGTVCGDVLVSAQPSAASATSALLTAIKRRIVSRADRSGLGKNVTTSGLPVELVQRRQVEGDADLATVEGAAEESEVGLRVAQLVVELTNPVEVIGCGVGDLD